jgi:hypothetical protein
MLICDVTRAGLEQRQQVPDEGEVAEVVGAELQLEPVRGRLPFRRGHHARVVDEDVDRLALLQQHRAQRGDRGQRRQVEGTQRHVGVRGPPADRGDRRLTLAPVADGHDDFGPGRREPSRDAEPDTVAGAGDDGPPAGQVRDLDVGLPAHRALPARRGVFLHSGRTSTAASRTSRSVATAARAR